MKRFIMLYLLSYAFFGYAQIHRPFKMRTGISENILLLNQTFSTSDSITLTINTPIEGFSLYGKLIQPVDSSFVRVLLEDTDGVNYLVYESNHIYNDTDTIVLDNDCMECSVLADIVPSKMRVFVKNAAISLDSVRYITHYANTANSPLHKIQLHTYQEQVLKEQAVEMASKWNAYNQENHCLWYADTTNISVLPWIKKKAILNIEDNVDTGGIEYYAGGIFEYPKHLLSFEERDSIWDYQLYHSPFVESFDWRNRHGKNWITPIKQQGVINSCWAFCAIGVAEAVVNLYYNQLLNMNLSEQELMSCCNNGNYNTMVGGSPDVALRWLAHNGVMDEESFPYQTEYGISCSDKPELFQERVYFNDAVAIRANRVCPDSLKYHLINNGPITFPYSTGNNIGHAVVLVGYGSVKEGDSIEIRLSNGYEHIVVDSLCPHIGETYWILKNSYGINWPYTNQGYFCMYLNRDAFKGSTYLTLPVVSSNHTDSDIICEDIDGDGYYFWGIGPRPNHCPEWVPFEPDGDDSDDTKGPMNEYGYLYDITEHMNDTIYINSDTIWNQKSFLYRQLVIQNGATLRVTNDVVFYKNVNITVRDRGSLIINGGRLQNAVVKIDDVSDSNIHILNNGIIERRDNRSFNVPLGNKMKIDHGKIQ